MPQVLDTRPPSGLHNRPAPKATPLDGDNPFAAILNARLQMPALPALDFRSSEARSPERTPEQSTIQNANRRTDPLPVENRRTDARDDRTDADKADKANERRTRSDEDDNAPAPEATLSEQRPTPQGPTGDKTAQSKATEPNTLREQLAKLSVPMTDKGPADKTPAKTQQANQPHQTAQPNGTGPATMRVEVQQATTGLVDHSLKQQMTEAKTGDLNSTLNSTGKPAQQAATLTSGATGQHSGQGATGQNNTGQNSGNQSNGGQNTGHQNSGGQNAAAPSAQAITPAGASKALPPTAQGGATQQISAQTASFSQTLSRTTASSAPTAPHKPTPRVTVADQVSVQIKKGAGAGLDKITIKLNPLELGRVDIKMETNDQGLTRALIVVERPETLDLLQRDARGLEKALQDSGLKTDSGSLNFSLHQDKQNNASRDQNGGQTGQTRQQDGQDQTDKSDSLPEQQIARGPRHDGDLDISI